MTVLNIRHPRLAADESYFRQQGAKGGAIGGRKAAERMTTAERRERARQGGLKAAANRRAKAKRRAD